MLRSWVRSIRDLSGLRACLTGIFGLIDVHGGRLNAICTFGALAWIIHHVRREAPQMPVDTRKKLDDAAQAYLQYVEARHELLTQ